MQIINPHLLMLRFWFTKDLRLGDPYESLGNSRALSLLVSLGIMHNIA